MLVQCWTSVKDGGPALYQHWVNVWHKKNGTKRLHPLCLCIECVIANYFCTKSNKQRCEPKVKQTRWLQHNVWKYASKKNPVSKIKKSLLRMLTIKLSLLILITQTMYFLYSIRDKISTFYTHKTSQAATDYRLQTIETTNKSVHVPIKTHHYIIFFVGPLHSKPGMTSYCSPSTDQLSW